MSNDQITPERAERTREDQREIRGLTPISSPQTGASASAFAAPVRRPVFRLVQVLRAIAALMVVAHHATIMLHQRDGLPIPYWLSGASGVDIFFVISGFVMMLSTAPLRHAAHPAQTFLLRRLERVVPLYWIATTAKLLVLLAAPALAFNSLGGAWHIAASYLFLPSLNGVGAFEPVVVVGWTLNFEMAFYLLFTLALLTRRPLLRLLGPVLLLVPLLGFIPQPHHPSLHWYQSTLLWEFFFGMLLAHYLPLIRRLPNPVAALLCLVGFWPLFLNGSAIVAPFRGLLWGLPALAVVTGAVALEERWGHRAPRWSLELGDASYSIYLVHGFVLPVCGILLARFGHFGHGIVPFSLLGMLVLSAAAGELVFRGLERPMIQWSARRRRSAIPVNASA